MKMSFCNVIGCVLATFIVVAMIFADSAMISPQVMSMVSFICIALVPVIAMLMTVEKEDVQEE